MFFELVCISGLYWTAFEMIYVMMTTTSIRGKRVHEILKNRRAEKWSGPLALYYTTLARMLFLFLLLKLSSFYSSPILDSFSQITGKKVRSSGKELN